MHLFNQSLAAKLQTTIERVPLEKIDPGMKKTAYLGQTIPPQVHKLPFDFRQELPYFDTTYMNDPSKAKSKRRTEWDRNWINIFNDKNASLDLLESYEIVAEIAWTIFDLIS